MVAIEAEQHSGGADQLGLVDQHGILEWRQTGSQAGFEVGRHRLEALGPFFR
jgi:hypothetical protein